MNWVTMGWLPGGALGTEVAEGGTGKGSCADTDTMLARSVMANAVKDFILRRV